MSDQLAGQGFSEASSMIDEAGTPTCRVSSRRFQPPGPSTRRLFFGGGGLEDLPSLLNNHSPARPCAWRSEPDDHSVLRAHSPCKRHIDVAVTPGNGLVTLGASD